MSLDIDALAAKKLLAVAGIGLLGIAGLAACDDEADAATDGDSTATTDGEGAEDAATEETCEVTPAEDGAGTDFESPLELCVAGAVEGWDVAVTAVELDGTGTVLDANPFNEQPADGSQYLLFTLTGTNTGDAAADPYVDLMSAVEFTEYRYEDTCGVLPADLVEVDEVEPGESFTANDCVFVDTEGVDEAVLALSSTSDLGENEVFYKLG